MRRPAGDHPSPGESEVTLDDRPRDPADVREAGAELRLGRQMAVGAAWTILLRIADRGIGIVSVAFLARVLQPGDFGLVALAVSVVAVIEVLGELNVEAALIRDPAAGRAEYDTAWTVRLLIALALGLVLLLSAGTAPQLLGDPRVAGILRWLSLGTVLGGLENIGPVEFQKQLDFRRDFLFRFRARVGATMVAVATALLWLDYRALVAGALAGSALRVGLSYWVHRYRPRLCLTGWRPLIGFSKWLLLQNLVFELNGRAAHFVIARMISVDVLAHFTVSTELANLATTELQAPIRRAVFPGYAQVASDRQRLSRLFLDTLGVLVLVGLPAAAGIALMAPDLIMVLLGPRWAPAIPLLRILALAGVIRALRTGSHPVYLSVNRPEITAALVTLSLVLTVPGLVVGTRLGGAPGVAWALVASSVVVLLVDYVLLSRILRLDFRALARVLWRPIVASAVMAIPLRAMALPPAAVPDAGTAMVRLTIEAITAALTYVGTLVLLWLASGRPTGTERSLVTMVRGAAPWLKIP